MHNHPTFEDGHKLIDMVLAYDKHEKEEEQKQYRHEFQRNMTLEGLEWELDEVSELIIKRRISAKSMHKEQT